MKKTISILAIFISLISCNVEHDEQDVVISLLENPQKLDSVLSRHESGKFYLDSVESKNHQLSFWSNEFFQIKDKYQIQSYGYWFRKNQFKIFYDERDVCYSTICVTSSYTKKGIDFVFKKIDGKWVLLRIVYTSP
jgi:hypothetical protein